MGKIGEIKITARYIASMENYVLGKISVFPKTYSFPWILWKHLDLSCYNHDFMYIRFRILVISLQGAYFSDFFSVLCLKDYPMKKFGAK